MVIVIKGSARRIFGQLSSVIQGPLLGLSRYHQIFKAVPGGLNFDLEFLST
jgi:hypothetical protein